VAWAEPVAGHVQVEPRLVDLADLKFQALVESLAVAHSQRAEEALRDKVGAMEIAEAQAEFARAAAQLRAIEKLR
jgi:F-type H+-transporting ATPase subunit epsilon